MQPSVRMSISVLPVQEKSQITYNDNFLESEVVVHVPDGCFQTVRITHTHLPLSHLAVERQKLIASNTPESVMQEWAKKMLAKVKNCKAHIEKNVQTTATEKCASTFMVQEDEQILRHLNNWASVNAEVQRNPVTPKPSSISTYNHDTSNHGPHKAKYENTPIHRHSFHSEPSAYLLPKELKEQRNPTTEEYLTSLISAIQKIQQCQLASLKGQLQACTSCIEPAKHLTFIFDGHKAIPDGFRLLSDSYQSMIEDDRQQIDLLCEEITKL